MRIIALDLGEKSLGICISDELQIIPIPLENYFFDRFDFNQASIHILDLVKKCKNINLILLGYPVKIDGQTSEATKNVEIFYSCLKSIIKKNNLNIKIKYFDERFSTKRAIELLKNKYSNKDIKNNKDMASAYIMLYDYLNSN